MKAIQNHVYGIKATFGALSKGQLWLFFIPGAVVGIAYFWMFYSTSKLDDSANTLKDVWFVGDYLAAGAHGFFGFVQTLLFEVFKFFVLVLLSPFNCILSEKFDNQLTGNKFDGGIIRILNDLLRAFLIVFLALIMEFFFMGVWWVLSWIPGLSLLDPVVYFCISSFFFGFAFYDYSLERYNIGSFSSWGIAFSNIGHMILTGSLFTLLFMIPVLGIILAPVLVTMISTATYLKMRGAIPPATV